MPEIIIPIHELRARQTELPSLDTPDFYVVGVWSTSILEGEDDPEDGAFIPIPYEAKMLGMFQCLDDPQTWDDYWGWDGDTNRSTFRIEGNSPSVSHPAYLRLRWGEGNTVKGIEMLPHEPSRWAQKYCRHCGAERSGHPEDCPTRRLRALMDTPDGPVREEHRKAIELWHQPQEEEDD